MDTVIPESDPGTCHRCGSPLVRAVAKQGYRAGKPLLRCSDFSCPTIINVEEGDDVTPPSPRAGESAQATFERLRAARTERMRRAIPLLAAFGIIFAVALFFLLLAATQFVPLAAGTAVGGLFLFIWWAAKQPDDVIYWGHGAEAERRVGAKLDSLERLGFVTLYDRRIPGRGGNIDAVTVGPSGAYVVETKHRGKGVEIVNRRLEVGGREQSDGVRQVTELAMLVQVSVAQLMNRHRLTVVPVICIGNRKVSGGDRAGGVLVVDRDSIAKRLAQEPTVLTPTDVQELATALDKALPPFERRSG